MKTTRYLYAGWRCLGELDHTDTLQRTYAWGLDNDDRLHLGDSNAALLWIHDHGTNETHLTSYDGNGNLTGLLSAQSTANEPTATYTYSPFGQLLTATGPYAHQNPYRFSTKPLEEVGHLYNYGFRHYSPMTGRWLSRDPIAEDGGLNLYGFVQNEPLRSWDRLGLDSFTRSGQRNRFGAFFGDFITVFNEEFGKAGSLGGAVERQMISQGTHPALAKLNGFLAFTGDATGLLNFVELSPWAIDGKFTPGPDGELQLERFGSTADQLGHAAVGGLRVAGTVFGGRTLRGKICNCKKRQRPGPSPKGRFPQGVDPKGDVYVVGRLPDTNVARAWPGHNVLKKDGWTPEKNIAWLKDAVSEGRTFYMASPVKQSNLLNKRGQLNWYGQELSILMKSGYKRVGSYLVPPCR